MRIIISFFLFGFVLSSCAKMGQNDMRATILEDMPLANAEQRVANQTADFVFGEWPERKWWEVFCDGGLSSAIEMALQANPSLQGTEAKVRAVKGESDIVRSRLFPKINALFNVLWVYFSKDLHKLTPNLDPNFHLYTAGADFSYEFDFWGKNRKLFQAALGEVAVEKALFEQAKLVLSTSVAVEYYNFQSSKVKCEVAEQLLANRQKKLELIVLRDSNRIDSAIDIDRMRQEIATLQENVSSLREELEISKSSLLALMGKNPSEEIGIPWYWKDQYLPFELPDRIGLDLVAHRADVAAGMANVKKTASLVGVAIAQFFPNIDLYGFLGFQTLHVDRLFSTDTFIPGLLPFIQLPILQGGKLRGYLKKQIALHEEAIYAYNDSVLHAANEVVSSISHLIGVNERLKLQADNAALAKHIYELTEVKYRQGMEALSLLLDVEEKYLWVLMNQVELERMKYEAAICLIKALGGGFSDA